MVILLPLLAVALLVMGVFTTRAAARRARKDGDGDSTGYDMWGDGGSADSSSDCSGSEAGGCGGGD